MRACKCDECGKYVRKAYKFNKKFFGKKLDGCKIVGTVRFEKKDSIDKPELCKACFTKFVGDIHDILKA